MKINRKKSFNSELWGLKSEGEFLKEFKGQNSEGELKKLYSEAVKICKDKGLKKVERSTNDSKKSN
jgi:hypothetical protein